MKAKRIMITAHCILNQNAVLEGWGRARGAFPIVSELVERGIGVIQLPCPEFIYYGLDRKPLEYEDYNFAEYRKLCYELALPVIAQLKEYLSNGYTFIGVFGIYNSPTCSISEKRGVYMEELYKLLEKEGIKAPYIEVPESYDEHSDGKLLLRELDQFLCKKGG